MVHSPSPQPRLSPERRWLAPVAQIGGMLGSGCAIALLIVLLNAGPRSVSLALCLGTLVGGCVVTSAVWQLNTRLIRLKVDQEQQAVAFSSRETRLRAETDDRVRERVHAATAEMSGAVRRLMTHLLETRLPAVIARTTVPAPPYEPCLGDEILTRVEDVVHVVDAVMEQQRDRRDALRQVLIALARRVQPSAHRIQQHATDIAEARLDDELVQATMMHIDHAAAQQARAAQSLAVLCGDWPGQQWRTAYRLVEIVRAASGRILDYRRIKVTGDPTLAATAAVVEQLIHLVAELLANATTCSPPNIVVEVDVRQVQRGAAIVIDDGGVGMDEYRLSAYNAIASGERVPQLEDLVDALQTGLHVVGTLAQRHGIRVTLTQSPLGGVRAVVLVREELIEIMDQGVPTHAQRADSAASAPTSTLPATGMPAAASPPAPPTAPAISPTGQPTPTVIRNAPIPQPSAQTNAPPLPNRRSPRHQAPPVDTAQPPAPPHPVSDVIPDRSDFLADYLAGAQGMRSPTLQPHNRPASPPATPAEEESS
ncbi:ATP-binding protein [Nonomuraea sp. NPDC004702]